VKEKGMRSACSVKTAGFIVILLVAVLGAASTSVNAAPSYCEGEISLGQLKSYTITYIGSREICYIPNGGGSSKLGARIAWWDSHDTIYPPNVTVDIYVAADMNRASYWTYLSSIQLTTGMKYSPPLWLNSGVVYIFSISTSHQVLVNLELKRY
jgi:hypothetical protein